MTMLPRAALLALPLALAACAPKTVVTIADAPVMTPPRPQSPAGAFGSVLLPPRDADGAWWTPNRSLAAGEAAWRLRAALNVAALRCTAPEVTTITASYNAMLKAQKAPIEKAYKTIRARYKAADAKTWQTSFDVDSTKLYNFFAQPAMKTGFCATAAEIAAQVSAIAPAGFPAFAEITLPAIDRRFTAFYDAYAQWQTAAADWDAKYGTAHASAQPIVTAGLN